MKIGAKVTWTHCTTCGKNVTMSLREGVVEELNGDMAIVRRRSRRRESVAISRLRLPGQKSQITEFVEIVLGREVKMAGS